MPRMPGPSCGGGSSAAAASSSAAAESSGPPSGEESIDRSTFVHATLRLLAIALDGMPGILHSARALRDIALQRTHGDQDIAAAHVVEGGTKHHIEDDEQLVRLCLDATGMPLPLAAPLWHRLRHIGQISELLGHDSASTRGRVLCACAGIVTRTEPIAMAAAHAVWFKLCDKAMLTQLPLAAAVDALDKIQGHITDAALIFLEQRQAVPQHEWEEPVEVLSVARAKLIARELLKDVERAARATARAGIAQAVGVAAADATEAGEYGLQSDLLV